MYINRLYIMQWSDNDRIYIFGYMKPVREPGKED